MGRKFISLQFERFMIGLGDFVLGILALAFFVSPYVILIAVGVSGLLYPIFPALHPAINFATTVILAGLLNIFCFDKFVYPVLPKVLDLVTKANEDAKVKNDLKRWGLDRSGDNEDET